MKTTHWLGTLLAASLLAGAGCKKAEQPQAQPLEFSGVKVDLPKLDTEFAGAAPEVLASVNVVKRSYSSGQLSRAIVELGKLAAIPTLTESQKKLVADLTEQTKQVMVSSPPPVGK